MPAAVRMTSWPATARTRLPVAWMSTGSGPAVGRTRSLETAVTTLSNPAGAATISPAAVELSIICTGTFSSFANFGVIATCTGVRGDDKVNLAGGDNQLHRPAMARNDYNVVAALDDVFDAANRVDSSPLVTATTSCSRATVAIPSPPAPAMTLFATGTFSTFGTFPTCAGDAVSADT